MFSVSLHLGVERLFKPSSGNRGRGGFCEGGTETSGLGPLDLCVCGLKASGSGGRGFRLPLC
jgi:hypothetical protein